MHLTDEQLEFIMTILGMIVAIVIAFKILRAIFTGIKNACKKLKRKIKRAKQKKIKGYKNYKGDTWYPDGTVYNEKTGKLEKPDYKN